MIYPGLISEEESRLLDCIAVAPDLLGVGLAGVAVDAKSSPIEVVLLWAPSVEPDDDLVEDFEADFVALVGLPQAEIQWLRARHVLFDEWRLLTHGERLTPIFWSGHDASEDWSIRIPGPWQLTRGDTVPNAGGMTNAARLCVHILEARNFTLSIGLEGVDQVSVSIEGDDATIGLLGDVSPESKSEIEAAFASASRGFSSLSNGGVWRLRWIAAPETPGPLSWPVLTRRTLARSDL